MSQRTQTCIPPATSEAPQPGAFTVPPEVPSPTVATCAHCGRAFKSIRDQWEHFMLNCISPPEYHCPKFLCSFVSEHTAEVKSHITTMHDKQAKFLLSCLDY
ncbi:hypothetical protein J6590_014930 [Homalodisca vitripennis]|nr:hypothetical protein J6590_014930 [Homalodisca vitripennis]